MTKFEKMKMQHDVKNIRFIRNIKISGKISEEQIYIKIENLPGVLKEEEKGQFNVLQINNSDFELPIEDSDEPATKSDLLKMLKLNMKTEESEALREEYDMLTGIITNLSINTSKEYIIKTISEDGVVKIGINKKFDYEIKDGTIKMKCPIKHFFGDLDFLAVGDISDVGHAIYQAVNAAKIRNFDYIHLNKPLEFYSFGKRLGILNNLIDGKINLIS